MHPLLVLLSFETACMDSELHHILFTLLTQLRLDVDNHCFIIMSRFIIFILHTMQLKYILE